MIRETEKNDHEDVDLNIKTLDSGAQGKQEAQEVGKLREKDLPLTSLRRYKEIVNLELRITSGFYGTIYMSACTLLLVLSHDTCHLLYYN